MSKHFTKSNTRRTIYWDALLFWAKEIVGFEEFITDVYVDDDSVEIVYLPEDVYETIKADFVNQQSEFLKRNSIFIDKDLYTISSFEPDELLLED